MRVCYLTEWNLNKQNFEQKINYRPPTSHLLGIYLGQKVPYTLEPLTEEIVSMRN